MNIPVLTVPEQRWECPNCVVTHVTPPGQPSTPFHDCRGLKGLHAPLVPAGTRAKVEAKVREDYVGGETVTHDGDGTPIMAIETTRDDGNDLAVLAPCATADFTAHGR